MCYMVSCLYGSPKRGGIYRPEQNRFLKDVVPTSTSRFLEKYKYYVIIGNAYDL